MLRVLTVVGARPQFIKAAAVSRAFLADGEVKEDIVHTGQHYDDSMSDSFFRELGIPTPTLNLTIGSGSHGAQTGRMLEGLEKAIIDLKPDWVLVYGDTNSTVAGALAAVKLHVPVAHVEAGLRSFNRAMPEEINRVVTDHISDILFAPTQSAVENLEREGIRGEKVSVVGDVMYDATLFASTSDSVLDSRLTPDRYVAATIHRAETTDNLDTLRTVFEGLSRSGLPVAIPLHPRTSKMIDDANIRASLPLNILILEPQGYFAMANLVKNAAVVATDSGGLQKEAFFHGVPCVTLRTETEWVELVELGWNVVQAPASAEEISNTIKAAIGRLGRPGKPYGDGKAAEKIVARLKSGRLALAG